MQTSTTVIGYLRGIIVEKYPPYLLLEVGNIGYELTAPLSTFYNLPASQKETLLYTHLSIYNDTQILYGFHNEQDRRLFRLLIKVNGVGPKMALVILSGIDSNEFIHCVLHQSIDQLICIPGVGRKTAERLIIEIKDELSRWYAGDSNLQENNSILSNQLQSTRDAINALITLGYKPQEAKRAVHEIQKPELTVETIIRLALKRLVLRMDNNHE